jgi:hypothetical protein
MTFEGYENGITGLQTFSQPENIYVSAQIFVYYAVTKDKHSVVIMLRMPRSQCSKCRHCYSVILDGFLRESAVKPVSNMIGKYKENQVFLRCSSIHQSIFFYI